MSRGELPEGEPHPGSNHALNYLKRLDPGILLRYAESFASVSMSGNKLAEVCSETMSRLLGQRPISDRYLMGLAFIIMSMEAKEQSFEDYVKGQKL